MKKIVLICDRCEDAEAVETMLIGLNGGRFALDACKECGEVTREELTPVLLLARHVGGKNPLEPAKPTKKVPAKSSPNGKPVNGTVPNAPNDPEQNKAIRQWAASKDIPCPPRGKIPQRVQDAWQDAHK